MTEHVCPVGALTTKDFRFKARVWFLRTAASVCQGCATGCNAHLDYDPRYNKAYRYRPRDNEKVNKFWMCDEGMLTYKEAHDGRVLEADGRRRVDGRRRSALEEAKTLFAGRARRSRSASSCQRAALARGQLGAARARRGCSSGRRASTGRAAPDGYEDTILIHRDKNPNTRGRAAARAGRASRSQALRRRRGGAARSRTSSRSGGVGARSDADGARAGARS